MKPSPKTSIVALLLVVLVALVAQRLGGGAVGARGGGAVDVAPSAPQPAPADVPSAPRPVPAEVAPSAPRPVPAEVAPSAPRADSDVGFPSARSWREHHAKHGAELGKLTAEEYLGRAQALRDAPLSQDVLERVRADGVITRFDRQSGAFVAFHADRTIRTFFRPRDGEAYFLRQAAR